MSKTVLAVLTGVLALSQGTGFQPVATVRELMEQIIMPTSDAVFGVGSEAPKDDQGWASLENSALMLAESGNLLLMRMPEGDSSVWVKESKALIDSGSAAYRAAKAKKADDILEAGDKIYETCVGCHDQYLKGK
jgi:hypothetical protein